ncbi:MAG: hypothetical protein ACOCRK_05340 [bacterium]
MKESLFKRKMREVKINIVKKKISNYKRYKRIEKEIDKKIVNNIGDISITEEEIIRDTLNLLDMESNKKDLEENKKIISKYLSTPYFHYKDKWTISNNINISSVDKFLDYFLKSKEFYNSKTN